MASYQGIFAPGDSYLQALLDVTNQGWFVLGEPVAKRYAGDWVGTPVVSASLTGDSLRLGLEGDGEPVTVARFAYLRFDPGKRTVGVWVQPLGESTKHESFQLKVRDGITDRELGTLEGALRVLYVMDLAERTGGQVSGYRAEQVIQGVVVRPNGRGVSIHLRTGTPLVVEVVDPGPRTTLRVDGHDIHHLD